MADVHLGEAEPLLQRSRCRKCPHPCLVLIKLYEIYLGFWVGHSLYVTEVTMREQASEGAPHEDCGTVFLPDISQATLATFPGDN